MACTEGTPNIIVETYIGEVRKRADSVNKGISLFIDEAQAQIKIQEKTRITNTELQTKNTCNLKGQEITEGLYNGI